LNSIVKFIYENQENIDKQINSDRSTEFYEKLNKKCTSYNYHHYYHRIPLHILTYIENQTMREKHNLFTTAQKSVTYQIAPGQEDGNIDFSYVNSNLKFGYVVDGSGHNKPQMVLVLNSLLDNFIVSYCKEINSQNFTSIEDARDFVKNQLEKLGSNIDADNRSVNDNKDTLAANNLKPAISFAQVIKIDNQFHLLSVQCSDTNLIIKRSDGTFDTSLLERRDDVGLGDKTHGGCSVKCLSVNSDDLIIGFSDGIGEFLHLDELEEIITSTTHTKDLLENLKNKIIAKGILFSQEYAEDPEKLKSRALQLPQGKKTASQARWIKYHTFDKGNCHDDISLFTLIV
jgi:hypothetical protein